MKLNISELDCVFISYDEPNAEKNFADLCSKAPWSYRVNGIKGSDNCHKAAADLAQSEWFITVDADNIVDEKFFELTIEVPDGARAFSWPGVNIINGLRYGNGSLKVWHKDFVYNMKSHEAADKHANQVDFCFEDAYRPMIDSYSVTHPNSSNYHAWRAGFREGVKMSLVNGVRPTDPMLAKLHWHNQHRLQIWCSVGAHVEYGLWAILGARHGCYKTNCTDWDYVEVRDFEKLSEIFKEVRSQDVNESIQKYGFLLEKEFGFKTTLLDQIASGFVVNMFADQYEQIKEQLIWTARRNGVV